MTRNQQIINFIREQFSEPNEFIPLHAPMFVGREKEYLNDAIDSTFVSSVGAYVDRFEREIEAYTGMKKAVAVVNGTNGLQVALRMAGVEANTEVITQAFTFVATANAIAYLHAHPVFVDVEIDSMGMSVVSLESFLNTHAEKRQDGLYNKTTDRRITACVPMHSFGFIGDIEGIIEVCHNWGIPVVEDAAEALGSEYNSQLGGTFGKIGVYSFNGNKIITSGGGGVLVTNDMELGKKAKHVSNTAKLPHKWEYIHDEIGYNYRMPNLNAALACAQLEQLSTYLADKRALANSYKSFFDGLGMKFLTDKVGRNSNYWLMTLLMENEAEKETFLEETNKNGVMTRPVWRLLHRLPMYSHCQRAELTNSEYLEARVVNIPSSPRLKS